MSDTRRTGASACRRSQNIEASETTSIGAPTRARPAFSDCVNDAVLALSTCQPSERPTSEVTSEVDLGGDLRGRSAIFDSDARPARMPTGFALRVPA